MKQLIALCLFLIRTSNTQFVDRKYLLLTVLLSTYLIGFAQERDDKAGIAFEELYDEPYAINKLFVQFQPFYGEMFVTNVNAGFGLEAHYYFEDKANFQASFRKTYGQRFYDFNRDLSIKNSNVSNDASSFGYFELGGTYHVKDFETRGTTKMLLYRKSYSKNRWASRVPLYADIPSKLRQIYGARAGGIFWNSSADINRALSSQGLTNSALLDANGNALPLTYQDEFGREQDVSVFSNVYSKGLYVGASLTRIRNIAVSIDNYEGAIDDMIFNAFLDVLISPAVSVDDVFYENVSYATDVLSLKKVGMRAGIEGRFNRALAWAYGAEIGYRPSFEGRSFYTMFKISFPVFSSNLDNKVESFGK